MDEMEFKATHAASSDDGADNEDQKESVGEESWEEEFNPLGMLDLVYVEEEEIHKNCRSLQVKDDAPVTSSTSNLTEQLNHVNDDSNEDDEEELEPVAAVDVSPVREDDFFPEQGMNEEVSDSSKSTLSIFRASNADSGHRQRSDQASQPVATEHNQQLTERHPHPQHVKSTQSLGVNHSNQVASNFPQQMNVQINEFPIYIKSLQLSWKLQQEQEYSRRLLSRREYYRRYRQKNPELMRIRNREYARRYREAHGDRVRERQREYIKKHRERKRRLGDKAVLLGSEQNDESALGDKCVEKAAVVINKDPKDNKSDMQSDFFKQNTTNALNPERESEIVIVKCCDGV